jgi:hypothetical protein
MTYGLDERNIRQSPGLWYERQLLTDDPDESRDDINGDFQELIPWEHPDVGPEEGRFQFVQDESRGFWFMPGGEDGGWTSPSVLAFTQLLIPRGHYCMIRRALFSNNGDDTILFEIQASYDGGQNWDTVFPVDVQGGGTLQLDPLLQLTSPTQPTPDPGNLPPANTLNAGGDLLIRVQATWLGAETEPQYRVYLAGTLRTVFTYGDYLPPQRYGEAAFE